MTQIYAMKTKIMTMMMIQTLKANTKEKKLQQ